MKFLLALVVVALLMVQVSAGSKNVRSSASTPATSSTPVPHVRSASTQHKIDLSRAQFMEVSSKVAAGKLARTAQDVEDCVACRYIWLQVEMDVGNTQIEENIYDSFTQNCIEAQKAPIFYPACQDMFDAVDDMIGDYMDGYTVNQLCENSRLCR